MAIKYFGNKIPMRDYVIKIAIRTEAEDAEVAISKIMARLSSLSEDAKVLSYVDEGGEETVINE